MKKCVPAVILAMVTLLACSEELLAVDICGGYPDPDPCLPGGVWDPILNSCSGYMGLKCYQCYSGEFCKTKEDPVSCRLIATGGNPLVISEYWFNKTVKEPCTTTLAHYRSAYQEGPDSSPPGLNTTFMLPPLVQAFQKLHAVTGNAETDDYHIVGGMGATMVIHITLISLSQQILENCQSDCPPYVDVLVQSPYYASYPYIVGLVNTTRWNPNADPTSPYTIEILTYPNNPNGVRRKPLVTDPYRVIHDMVYYWPMFTDVDKKLKEPIMIFSSSKHDGLAGTRFGWGLIEDMDLATRMSVTLDIVVLGLSVDAELRVLTSLQTILSDAPTPSGMLPFHQFGRDMIHSRFEELKSVLTCATLTNYPSNSTGAYAWIKCAEGVDCVELFEKVNLLTIPGTAFGSTSQYARVSMIQPSVEFSVLVEKVKAVCSE